MERLKLSPKAQEVTARLVGSKNSERAGYIAAVDPETGEIFLRQNGGRSCQGRTERKKRSEGGILFCSSGLPLCPCPENREVAGLYLSGLFSKSKWLHSQRQPTTFI